MIYASYYNQETKKYMTIELTDENKAKYEKDSIEHDTLIPFKEIQFAVANTSIYNKNIENGELKVIICKDCKKSFSMDKKEMDWYADKNYELPVRCPLCRQKRKKEKEKTNQ